jgi:DNA-directed RNA polymerase specialized sigma24 family protein
MNETEVIETILKISKKLAHKYTFASYEVEDIEQEAFLIGIAGLDKYDHVRPLDNFMYVHINNRLKTFKRDNYYRLEHGAAEKIQKTKKDILEPLDIQELYHIATGDTISEDAELSELLQIIDDNLPSNMRSDYLKLKNNAPLSKSRKSKVVAFIQSIVEESENEEG